MPEVIAISGSLADQVHFTRKDGLCPFFLYGGLRYYIQDRYITPERYDYQLMSRPVDSYKKSCFPNWESGEEYVMEQLEGKRFKKHSCPGPVRFETSNREFFILPSNIDPDNHTVDIVERIKHSPESGVYDSYEECLAVAKQILAARMEQDMPQQMSMEF